MSTPARASAAEIDPSRTSGAPESSRAHRRCAAIDCTFMRIRSLARQVNCKCSPGAIPRRPCARQGAAVGMSHSRASPDATALRGAERTRCAAAFRVRARGARLTGPPGRSMTTFKGPESPSTATSPKNTHDASGASRSARCTTARRSASPCTLARTQGTSVAPRRANAAFAKPPSSAGSHRTKNTGWDRAAQVSARSRATSDAPVSGRVSPTATQRACTRIGSNGAQSGCLRAGAPTRRSLRAPLLKRDSPYRTRTTYAALRLATQACTHPRLVCCVFDTAIAVR